MSVTVHHADNRELLKTLADASIDSCVCDPPYALVSISKRFGKDGAAPAKAGKTGAYARASAGFMGQKWDTGETAFDPAFWAEVYRVLKPGGHVLAFSGTRTYHRLACAIEDAGRWVDGPDGPEWEHLGFEIRDQIGWLFGSGFPKSHDVCKGIDKKLGKSGGKVAKGAEVRRIRPGAEQHKDGSWEKLDGRVYQPHEYVPGSPEAAAYEGWGTALKPAWEPVVVARKPLDGTVAANVLAHGTGALNIGGCRVGSDGGCSRPADYEPVRGESNEILGRGLDLADAAPRVSGLGRWPANVIHDGSDEVVDAFPLAPGQLAPVGPQNGAKPSVNCYGDYGPRDQCNPRGDAGSAARFFYTAKADAEDRLGSKHPTVKPIDLMAYLCRLVTPPGGTVLDPFAGTGTTGLAAMREGFDCILIEREEAYVADIHRRLAWARGEGRLTAQEMSRSPEKTVEDLPLFGGAAA